MKAVAGTPLQGDISLDLGRSPSLMKFGIYLRHPRQIFRQIFDDIYVTS